MTREKSRLSCRCFRLYLLRGIAQAVLSGSRAPDSIIERTAQPVVGYRLRVDSIAAGVVARPEEVEEILRVGFHVRNDATVPKD